MRYFKSISLFKRIVTANLLCIVITFNILSTAFHTQLHHHESETVCSVELDNDACHLFEVHNIKTEDCDGSHDHIKPTDDDCFACKYISQRSVDFIENNTKSNIIIQNRNESYQPVNECVYFNYSFTNYLRGPPAFI